MRETDNKDILLVDPVESFRERAEERLRRRGFTVRKAARSAEAKIEFAQRPPELVVVDGILPDGTGIDLVGWIRERYAEVVVVFANHKFAEMEAHAREAERLGAALILEKPMTPDELVAAILAHLGLDPGAENAPGSRAAPSAGDPAVHKELAALRESYVRKIPDLFAAVGERLASGASEEDQIAALEEAHRVAHSLHGTAGSLGLSWVSDAANAMEGAVGELLRKRRVSSQPRRIAPSEMPAGISMPARRPFDSAPPAEPTDETSSVVNVLVVDDDPIFLSQIALAAREHLIRVYPARNLTEAVEAAQTNSFDCAIVDIYLERGEDAFEIARALRAARADEPLPISFISGNTSMPIRIAAAHAGGSQFLQKPITGADLAAAVRHLVSRTERLRPRVLVVDDDEAFLVNIRRILDAEALTLRTVSDPRSTLDEIERFRPDIVLLDVVMPEINGFDVCRVLRASEAWKDLPILFLTVHSNDKVRLKCFEAGGDDYIIKPVLREELLARIEVRLERMRLHRERADRDTVTGLPNRRAFLELLQMRMSESARAKKPLSLALIDIDHFKEVNDEHGHLSGDRVLSRFGHLLASRFRTSDIRGRWGGDEFVVVFYGEDAATSKMIIGRVQDELRDMAFTGDRGEQFRITFSAGISSFPEVGEGVETLFRDVDAKLYQAKRAGRDAIEI
jgi:diguanylate cyclase (GGDEF)-like protein